VVWEGKLVGWATCTVHDGSGWVLDWTGLGCMYSGMMGSKVGVSLPGFEPAPAWASKEGRKSVKKKEIQTGMVQIKEHLNASLFSSSPDLMARNLVPSQSVHAHP
jgi:hypothetical protein